MTRKVRNNNASPGLFAPRGVKRAEDLAQEICMENEFIPNNKLHHDTISQLQAIINYHSNLRKDPFHSLNHF